MANIELELETVRREVAELRSGLRPPEPYDPLKVDIVDAFVKQTEAKQSTEGSLTGAAHLRILILQGIGGNNVWANSHGYGELSKLPSEEDTLTFAAALGSNPLGVRVLRYFVERTYTQQPMRATKTELAAQWSVSESDLEEALRPLVGVAILNWGKQADGTEYYQMNAIDKVFAFLSLV